MPIKIRIVVKDIVLNAELLDTSCAKTIVLKKTKGARTIRLERR